MFVEVVLGWRLREPDEWREEERRERWLFGAGDTCIEA
jgi:hypothetical protein